MSDDKPRVWLPLVVGDYLKDTARLTTEQHGAYLLLLMDYWTSGPLVDDDRELAAVTGMTLKKWRLTRVKLIRYFTVVDGFLRQKRMDAEIAYWSEKKRVFSERAAAGGRAKAAKSTSQAPPQEVLNACTSSLTSPTVERASKKALSHSGETTSVHSPLEGFPSVVSQRVTGEERKALYAEMKKTSAILGSKLS